MNSEITAAYGVVCSLISASLILFGVHDWQGVCTELALVDVAENKLKAEKMDLADGLAFMKHRTIVHADTGTCL